MRTCGSAVQVQNNPQEWLAAVKNESIYHYFKILYQSKPKIQLFSLKTSTQLESI
jgi:hypothetical protein